MKYLILHADGMADLACAELGGSTPFRRRKLPILTRSPNVEKWAS